MLWLHRKHALQPLHNLTIIPANKILITPGITLISALLNHPYAHRTADKGCCNLQQQLDMEPA